MKNLLIRSLTLAAACSLPWSAFGAAGTTSANFLKIGTGARAAAMADSFTAVADDPTALYWNPAGLALLNGTGLSTTHGQWLQGVSQDYLALAHRFPGAGGAGLGLTLQNTQPFNAVLEDSLGNYSGTGAAVSSSDWALSMAYADSLGRFLPGQFLANTYLGLKMNLLGQNTPTLGDTGVSFEAGFLHLIPSSHLAFGLALQNIGTDLLDHSQPFLLKAGASWYQSLAFVKGDRLTLALDSDIHADTGLKPSMGAEYRTPLSKDIAGAFRTGARATDDLQGFSTLTFGGGLQKDFGDFAAGLDYAFVPYGAVGSTHRFTLNISLPAGPQDGGQALTVPSLGADVNGGAKMGSAPLPQVQEGKFGSEDLRYVPARSPNGGVPATETSPAPTHLSDGSNPPIEDKSMGTTGSSQIGAPSEGKALKEDLGQATPAMDPLQAGQQAMEAGKLEEARKLLKEALAKDPSNSVARQLLGNCLIKMGRLDEAQRLFQPSSK